MAHLRRRKRYLDPAYEAAIPRRSKVRYGCPASPTSRTRVADEDNEVDLPVAGEMGAEYYIRNPAESQTGEDPSGAPINDRDYPQTSSFIEDADSNMFLGSISRADVILMILSLAMRHKLTEKAILDIFYMVDIFAGQEVLKSPKYTLKKALLHFHKDATYHFFCSVCKKNLASFPSTNCSQEVICPTCNAVASSKGDSYFVTFNIATEIRSCLERDAEYLTSGQNDVSDISSGKLYKRNFAKNLQKLTYNVSMDGASFFKSSKRAVWPIQLTVNELSPKNRFKSPIIWGIWVGKGEPLIQVMLEKVVEEAKTLASVGVTWRCGDSLLTSKLYSLCFCVDSVARPKLLNSYQFNGYMGCSYCHHPGVLVGNTIKYVQNVPPYTQRTHETVLEDIERVSRGMERSRGVKGITQLTRLEDFDLVWGLPPDYMHSTLLGVSRQLMEIWMCSPGKAYHIGKSKAREAIDKCLLHIRPPSELQRLPRSLKEREKWKASEWRNWLLYYSIPCLSGVLPDLYLKHFSLLVGSIHSLSKKKVTESDMENSSVALHKFVWEMQIFYGDSAMTFNVHLLLHLPKSVEMTGPLWSTSTFPYESGIYQIKRVVHEPKSVVMQIAKYKARISCLSWLGQHQFLSQTARKFCTSLKAVKQNKKVVRTDCGQVVLLGAGHVYEGVHVPQPSTCYHRMRVKGVLYSSSDYRTCRTDDSYVILSSGEFGRIDKILYKRGSCQLVISLLLCKHSESYAHCSHIFSVEETNSVITVSVNAVREKCVFVSGTTNNSLCLLACTFEVQ